MRLRVVYNACITVRFMYHSLFQDFELLDAVSASWQRIVSFSAVNTVAYDDCQERLFLFLKLWVEQPGCIPSIDARHRLTKLANTALNKSQASSIKWLTLKVCANLKAISLCLCLSLSLSLSLCLCLCLCLCLVHSITLCTCL
jgi:hypothetical protein